MYPVTAADRSAGGTTAVTNGEGNMDKDELITRLVEHSKDQRHRGGLEEADVSTPGGNPGCGDVITMHVKAEPDEPTIAAVTFEGSGCTISQAAASILLEQVNRDRLSFEEVLDFPYEDMLELLGPEVVGSRYTCATLALGTLKTAVKTIEMDRRLRAAGHSDEDIRRLREALAASGDSSRR